MSKRISYEKENKIIELYKNGSGTCEIAKVLQINRCTVLLYLKKNNLNPKRITRPYKNKHNIHFFSKYTKESAYWAGFIMADGNVNYTKPKYYVQIGLSEKDKNHLQKFSDAIDFTGPLYEYKKNNAISIHVRGKWFVDDLLSKYGIVERKSLIAVYPKYLPKELHSHFIRGYFDGDGSVSNKRSLTISFIGNENIIKSIRDILHQTLKLKISGLDCKAYLRNTKSQKIKQFVYSGESARKIIKWLYNDTNENIRLDRKYDKCMEWLNRVDKRFLPYSEERKNKISKVSRGENNPNAKLKNKDILKIRELYFSGNNTIVDLSKIYDVSYNCIRDVIIKKTFREI